MPGYGAQGAGAADAVAGFVEGQGGCVNASRSVTFPAGSDEAATEADWVDLIGAAIEAAQADLKSAL